jgi:hypothetical protein
MYWAWYNKINCNLLCPGAVRQVNLKSPYMLFVHFIKLSLTGDTEYYILYSIVLHTLNCSGSRTC